MWIPLVKDFFLHVQQCKICFSALQAVKDIFQCRNFLVYFTENIFFPQNLSARIFFFNHPYPLQTSSPRLVHLCKGF